MLWAKLRRAESVVPGRGGLISGNLEQSSAMKLAVFIVHVAHSTLYVANEHEKVPIDTARVCPVQHVRLFM